MGKPTGKLVLLVLAVILSISLAGCSIPDSLIAEYTLNKAIHSEIQNQAQTKSNITAFKQEIEKLLNCPRSDLDTYNECVNSLTLFSDQYKAELIQNNKVEVQITNDLKKSIESRETEVVDGSETKYTDGYAEYELYDKSGNLIGVTSSFDDYKKYQKEVWGEDVTLESALADSYSGDEASAESEALEDSADQSGSEDADTGETLDTAEDGHSETSEDIIVGEYSVYKNKIVLKCINNFNMTTTLVLYLDNNGKVVNMLGY